MKESTAQWVNRDFGVNKVITNQSCKEVLSRSLNTKEGNGTSMNEEIRCDDLARFIATNQLSKEMPSQSQDTGNVQLGKLWSDQVEKFQMRRKENSKKMMRRRK